MAQLKKVSLSNILEFIALIVGFLGFFGLALVAIKFFQLTNLVTEASQLDKDSMDITSGLGSLLSGIGTLFSFASMIYFIAALKISEKQARDSKKVQDAQQFENTFFKLIELHHSMTSSLRIDNLQGLEIFGAAKRSIEIAMSTYYMELHGEEISLDSDMAPPPETIEDAKAKLDLDYIKRVHNRYQYAFNHYIRNLYHIFKYLYKCRVIDEDKRKDYAAILRAQLSQNELYCILFNSMVKGLGNPNFLWLIKEFNILDNFNDGEVDPYVFYELWEELVEEVENPFIKANRGNT